MGTDIAIARLGTTLPEKVENNSVTEVEKRLKPEKKEPVEDKGEARKALSSKEIEQVASDVQKQIKKMNTELRLEIDNSEREVIVKIVESETDTVIREIPPKELREISKRMKELMGAFYDSKT